MHDKPRLAIVCDPLLFFMHICGTVMLNFENNFSCAYIFYCRSERLIRGEIQ